MTVTRRMIRSLREQSRMDIDNNLEALILQKYGTEPYPHTYTEQDLYEQIRKLVMRYHREKLIDISTEARKAARRPKKS